MKSIFTYGSLMHAPVWQRVVRGEYVSMPALLRGYARFAVKGEEYPAIRPSDNDSSVPGRLYFAVSADDISLLDTFEGKYYLRSPVTVFIGNEAVAAETYVLRRKYYGILSDNTWDADAFAIEGIRKFMAQYTVN